MTKKYQIHIWVFCVFLHTNRHGSEINYDNVTSFLNTIDVQIEIPLSASEGTKLPLKFIPKKYYTRVTDRENNIDLINITHHYDNLYIINSLHVKPTLFIDIAKDSYKSAPLTFVNKNGSNYTSISYPLEAPDDTRYVNYNSRFFTGGAQYKREYINSEFNKLKPDHDIYTKSEYDSEHVRIRG